MKEKNVLIRRIIMIIAFYSINFGLWEILVRFMPREWASFGVYAVLFPVTVLLLGKQLKEEWKRFVSTLKNKRRFVIEMIVYLIIYLLSGGIVLLLASMLKVNIMPQNNENISAQLHTIPVCFTFIQTCIFAPIIEETTFRYSIIGQVDKKNKFLLFLLCAASVILFDAIHIFTFREFFYYLAPAIVLTGVFVRKKSVIASMILHSSVNLIGMIMFLFQ